MPTSNRHGLAVMAAVSGVATDVGVRRDSLGDEEETVVTLGCGDKQLLEEFCQDLDAVDNGLEWVGPIRVSSPLLRANHGADALAAAAARLGRSTPDSDVGLTQAAAAEFFSSTSVARPSGTEVAVSEVLRRTVALSGLTLRWTAHHQEYPDGLRMPSQRCRAIGAGRLWHMGHTPSARGSGPGSNPLTNAMSPKSKESSSMRCASARSR